jgi:16S rRNA (cytosine967-C5)-methyltransferase
MWLRVNCRRGSAADYLQRLRAAGTGARLEARVPFAVVLDEACDVGELPGFADGDVSVQDLAAQCVAFPLALTGAHRVLDACAAPGGKTTLIAERAPDLARLVAVELDPKRLQRIRDNLRRGGLSAELVNGDATDPDAWANGARFDRILVDAPCSALGVIRRHPDIRLRKAPAGIDRLPALQMRLLHALWRLLEPGGRLVYATCTLTRSENRDVLAAFVRATADAAVVPAESWDGWPGFGQPDDFGRQILPGEAGADGFYYAALERR